MEETSLLEGVSLEDIFLYFVNQRIRRIAIRGKAVLIVADMGQFQPVGRSIRTRTT